MLDKILVKISLKNDDIKVLKALHEATDPENKFAPQRFIIDQSITGKLIVFKLEAFNIFQTNGIIDSIKRTVDDFIASLNIAYLNIKEAIKYEKTEILRNNRERTRGHSRKRS